MAGIYRASGTKRLGPLVESTDINREAASEGSQAQARSAAAPGSGAHPLEALKGRRQNPVSPWGIASDGARLVQSHSVAPSP